VATEKQIAANCANAKRSTGPKTAAGKKKSSRNAFRHGLSSPAPVDLSTSAELQMLAVALAGEQATPEQLAAATEFAHAQAQMARIDMVRAAQWSAIDLDAEPDCNLKNWKRLASLDRYCRYAFTRRKKASKILWSKS
jgi:hypothetical protein